MTEEECGRKSHSLYKSVPPPHPLPLPLGEVAERSEVGEGANPQQTANTLSVTANAVPALPEGEPRSPAALFPPPHPNKRKQYDEPFPRGGRWPGGPDEECGRKSHSPYKSVPPPRPLPLPLGEVAERSEVGEGANPPQTANTLSVTANAVPALPEGEPRAPAALFHPLLPSVGVRWYAGALGRCGHRPLRIGGGTYLYRKLDFCPHSSSGPSGHLPPRGKGSSYCFLLFGIFERKERYYGT